MALYDADNILCTGGYERENPSPHYLPRIPGLMFLQSVTFYTGRAIPQVICKNLNNHKGILISVGQKQKDTWVRMVDREAGEKNKCTRNRWEREIAGLQVAHCSMS